MNCQKLEFGFGNAPKYENLKLIDSDTFAELCGYVEELARGFKFVRVDTFVTDNTYYIGELTFTTGAGYDSWKPYEYEKKYGDLISVR
jgi:hypothetical protein